MSLRAVPATCAASHRAALESVRSTLKARFLERNDIVDAMLAALLCKQHVLLLGLPGTAKSALASALTSSIDGARLFSWLLTKFSTPEELFGPVSLRALQQDRVARITTSKLPEADVVFLDEIFKANSAILNALLTVINERQFYNDGQAVPCPLRSMIGASNELPESDELEALFDRFLVRLSVPYLADAANVRALLTATARAGTDKLTMDELRQCQAEAAQVDVPPGIIDAVLAIKERVEEAGFRASDRRWQQSISLLRAYAYLNGDDAVGEDHLEIIVDSIWRDPKDRPAVAAIVGVVGNPLNVRAVEILDAAKEAVTSLGSTDPKGAADKAEWLKSASLIESRLSDMEAELQGLITQNPKRNLRRVKEVVDNVQRFKMHITRRVAALYNL